MVISVVYHHRCRIKNLPAIVLDPEHSRGRVACIPSFNPKLERPTSRRHGQLQQRRFPPTRPGFLPPFSPPDSVKPDQPPQTGHEPLTQESMEHPRPTPGVSRLSLARPLESTFASELQGGMGRGEVVTADGPRGDHGREGGREVRQVSPSVNGPISIFRRQLTVRAGWSW